MQTLAVQSQKRPLTVEAASSSEPLAKRIKMEPVLSDQSDASSDETAEFSGGLATEIPNAKELAAEQHTYEMRKMWDAWSELRGTGGARHLVGLLYGVR